MAPARGLHQGRFARGIFVVDVGALCQEFTDLTGLPLFGRPQQCVSLCGNRRLRGLPEALVLQWKVTAGIGMRVSACGDAPVKPGSDAPDGNRRSHISPSEESGSDDVAEPHFTPQWQRVELQVEAGDLLLFRIQKGVELCPEPAFENLDVVGIRLDRRDDLTGLFRLSFGLRLFQGERVAVNRLQNAIDAVTNGRLDA